MKIASVISFSLKKKRYHVLIVNIKPQWSKIVWAICFQLSQFGHPPPVCLIPTRLHRNPSPYTRVRYFIMEIIRVFVTVVHRPEITRLLYELV